VRPSNPYARCRTLGHSWDPIPVTKPPTYGVAIDLRCEHCHTVRRDTISRITGDLMTRRYDYEDDYRDVEHSTRSIWRGRWISTLEDHLREFGGEAEPGAPIKPDAVLIPMPKRARERRAS